MRPENLHAKNRKEFFSMKDLKIEIVKIEEEKSGMFIPFCGKDIQYSGNLEISGLHGTISALGGKEKIGKNITVSNNAILPNIGTIHNWQYPYITASPIEEKADEPELFDVEISGRMTRKEINKFLKKFSE